MHSERILKIIDTLEQGNKSSFDRKVVKSPQYIQKLVKDGHNPSSKVLTSILDSYPELSSKWLLSGTGNMFESKDVRSAASAIQTLKGVPDIKGVPASYSNLQNMQRIQEEGLSPVTLKETRNPGFWKQQAEFWRKQAESAKEEFQREREEFNKDKEWFQRTIEGLRADLGKPYREHAA